MSKGVNVSTAVNYMYQHLMFFKRAVINKVNVSYILILSHRHEEIIVEAFTIYSYPPRTDI